MDDLPLLELFTKLRKSGVPLGIQNYELALQSLQAGYGLSRGSTTPADQRAALARLCRTLWVRTPDEQRLLDYHLEQLFKSEALPEPAIKPQRRIKVAIASLVGLLIVGTGLYFGLPRLKDQIYKNQPHQTPSSPQPQTQAPNPLPAAGPQSPGPASSPTPSPTPNPPSVPVPTYWMVWSIPVMVGLGMGGWWLARGWLKRRSGSSAASEPVPEPSPNLTSKLFRETNDAVQVAQAVLQVTQQPNHPRDRFVLTGDYLPVTQRQMKQSWRHLRRMVREGVATELDVEATVRQIAQDGLLLEPVLVAARVNRTELVLLIDQDGSMVPFHSLSARLAETAQRGGRLGRAGIYYFQNCPMDYLYHDPLRLEPAFLLEVLAQFRRDRTVVLIFSDAGAARGGLNHRRVSLTLAFLKRLKRQVRYVAWLNPMPKTRWAGTTAGEIARHVPMFEGTRQGMDQAIDALRGRHPMTISGQEEVEND